MTTPKRIEAVKYYGNWRTETFDCPECKWSGLGSELKYGEWWGDGTDLNCPRCYVQLSYLEFPTIAESRANWDKLTPAQREKIERIERYQAKFEAQKLKKETVLPDIQANSFVLSWDIDHSDETGPETLIKFNDVVLFREPAFYEGYWRFIEVAELLKARYGAALCDLIPTEVSGTFLYGDFLHTVDKVKNAREKLSML